MSAESRPASSRAVAPARARFERVVRAVAGFDLAVTACLAVPALARGFIEILFDGDAAAGFASPRVDFEPLHWLFVHLAGVLGVLWAAARLRAPTLDLAALDVFGRIAVAAVILYAGEADGMTPLLHVFVATELIGAGLEYWAIRQLWPEPAD
jgi:hypothetical protein